MNTINHILLCVLEVLTLSGCTGSHSKSVAEDNSRLAFEIQQMTINEPEKALAMLDSAEQNETIKPFMIDYLRCLAYHNGQSDYKKALRYALKSYDNPETASMPDIHKSLIDMIANEYYENGDYEESMRYCNVGIEQAIKDNDKSLEANLHVTLATDLAALKRNDEAWHRLNMAMDILEKKAKQSHHEHTAWDNYVYSVGMAIYFLIDNEKWNEALAMQPRYEEAIKGLEGCEDLMDGQIDMRKASGYSAFAYAYASKGDLNNANDIYSKFQSTQYASTHDGALMIIPYLVEAHRYNEALRFIQSEKEYWKVTADTISESYIDMCLNNELKIYDEQGEFNKANRIRQSIIEISDRIHEVESKTTALELAEIYKTTEQALQIEQHKAAIQKRNVLIAAISVILILIAFFMVKIIRYNCKIRNKNISQRKIIDELMDYKDELLVRREEVIKLNEELTQLRNKDTDASIESPDIPAVPDKLSDESLLETDNATDSKSTSALQIRDTDRILFEKISLEIITKELYLDHDFSRNYLLEKFHIPVNRFSMIFKEFAGCSFTQYIQQCRLDHAVRLMRDKTDWSLDAIAKDSNMSRSAFYDQFQKKYGMTPTEYLNNHDND